MASPESPGPGRADPYEFTEAQGRVIARLGSKMRFVGAFAVGIGVIALVYAGMRRDPGLALLGLLYLVTGGWTARAGSSFRSVALTQGSDITNLMAALNELRKLFTLQYWICLVAIVLALVLLGASVVGTVG
jgi:hypothetical protein